MRFLVRFFISYLIRYLFRYLVRFLVKFLDFIDIIYDKDGNYKGEKETSCV